jgi:ArsR family transcriptional regulator
MNNCSYIQMSVTPASERVSIPTDLSTSGLDHRPDSPGPRPASRVTPPGAPIPGRGPQADALGSGAETTNGVGQGAPDACEVFAADEGRIAHAHGLLVPEATAAALADTFRVLGDPTRVRILDAISHGELCVCDIATLVGMSESAVSHQLRLLRTMRLVRARRSGRMVFYTLDDHHIIDLFAQGLRHVQEG